MKALFCFMISAFLSVAVQAQKTDQFKWLLGTWKINVDNGFVLEQWKQKNDSTLTGKSMFVKAAGDSAVQETIEMSLRKGEWSYTPTVGNQNSGMPVTFKVIFIGSVEFICENRAHDFPQRISYRRIKNTLHATIEGKRNGKYSKQNYDFSNE
jgi:hypothetical protein